MVYYENLVILDALLSDEEINAEIEKIKTRLEANGACMIKIDPWGRRRLAYLIKKRRDGYYVFFYFTIDNKNFLKEMEKRYLITETILRAIFFRLEKKEAEEVLKDYFAEQKKKEISEEKAAVQPVKAASENNNESADKNEKSSEEGQ